MRVSPPKFNIKSDFRSWLREVLQGLDDSERENRLRQLELHFEQAVKWGSADEAGAREALHVITLEKVQLFPADTRDPLERSIEMERQAEQQAASALETAARVHVGNLILWLEMATDGLCDEAKERISKEITVHYADAVQDAKERGMTDIQAHNAVMAGLGDPKKARREFKRTYLTVTQAKTLKASSQPAKMQTFAVTSSLIMFSLFAWLRLSANLEEAGHNTIWALVAVASFIMLGDAMLIVGRRMARHGKTRLAMLFNLCYVMVITSFASIIISFWVFPFMLLLLCFAISLFWVPIWIKLRKLPFRTNETILHDRFG